MTGPAPIGHNGPPRPFYASAKIETAQAILDRHDLTAAQKCVGVGIVLAADKDGAASLKTSDLQRFASAGDRETVFRATKRLKALDIVDKTSRPGQAGAYKVLPAKLIEEVTQAFDDLQSSRHKADRMGEGEPVGFDPTSQAKPVGSNPTSRHEPDQSSRAYIEPPSEVLLGEKGNTPPKPPQAASEDLGGGDCKPGEERIGPSVFVNCETVRHRGFTLSIPSIAMQLVLANLGYSKREAEAHAKDAAIAHALQWAAEIDGGKLARDVVPSNPANFIRGSIVSQKNKQAAANRVGKAKLSRW